MDPDLNGFCNAGRNKTSAALEAISSANQEQQWQSSRLQSRVTSAYPSDSDIARLERTVAAVAKAKLKLAGWLVGEDLIRSVGQVESSLVRLVRHFDSLGAQNQNQSQCSSSSSAPSPHTRAHTHTQARQ